MEIAQSQRKQIVDFTNLNITTLLRLGLYRFLLLPGKGDNVAPRQLLMNFTGKFSSDLIDALSNKRWPIKAGRKWSHTFLQVVNLSIFKELYIYKKV